MAINYGWFASISEPTPLAENISGLSNNGASLEITAKKTTDSDANFLAGGLSQYAAVDFGGKTATIRNYSKITRAFNLGFSETEPENVKVELFDDNGTPAYKFYVNDIPRATVAGDGGTNSLWSIKYLTSADSQSVSSAISRATLRSDASTVVVDWDGNWVLNAAGDKFILRTDANEQPSGDASNPLSAETGYEFKMYDKTSPNGNHINLPASTTWQFSSATTLPTEVYSGSTGNSFTTPPGFVVTAIQFAGFNVDFTFDEQSNTGQFTAPPLGTDSRFEKFGTVELVLIDANNGTEARGSTEWLPQAPYVYLTLEGDPDTTSMTNAYYNWPDPPLMGAQAVYDPTNYKIRQGVDINGDPTSAYYGRLIIEPDAPSSFAVNEYIIDDGGIQEFERNSSSAVVIGETPQMTLNGPSTVTITEGDSYTDQGANWTDGEDGTGTAYSSLIINESTAPGTYTQQYSYTDTDDNTVTRSRTIVVEPAQVIPGPEIAIDPITESYGAGETFQPAVNTVDNFGDGLTYTWTATGGLTFDNAAIQQPTVTVDSVDTDKAVIIECTVTDGQGKTASASISIQLIAVPPITIDDIDTLHFELVTDGNIQAFPDMLNREKISIRVTDNEIPPGLTDENGLLILDHDIFDRIEIHSGNGGDAKKVTSVDGAPLGIRIRDSVEAHVLMGRLAPTLTLTERDPGFKMVTVAYLKGVDEGLVLTATQQEPTLKASTYKVNLAPAA